MSLSRCITSQDVTCRAPIQWFQINPDCKPKKTYSHHNAILDKQKANLDHCDGKCTELRMHLFIVENELHSAFPNTEVALHIYLCLVVSNCTEEWSFSKLRRYQNYLRSSIVQEKSSMLSQTSMEREILGDVDLETIINDFVCKKCGIIKLFVADIFSKSTPSQSGRNQGHFNKFVSKYSLQSNAFTITRLVHGNVIPMGIPWKTSNGLGWDRHKLLWDGNGTNKYVPWTTLVISNKLRLHTKTPMLL